MLALHGLCDVPEMEIDCPDAKAQDLVWLQLSRCSLLSAA